MFAPLMGRRPARGIAAGTCVLALSAAGCGGEKRQDADEPRRDFKMELVRASFPADQQVGQTVQMRIRVRNAGKDPVPNAAVTVQTQPRKPGGAPAAFAQAVDDPRLADPQRPVWIVDRGPAGGDTAYTNTWALGKLPPGKSKSFNWRVTAVKPGRYTIDYEIAPGLDGRARLAPGSRGSGSFRVRISDDPVDARVNADGEVERGQ